MNYFDKITNYFLNRYQNNLKYRHNFLSYLKIIFERNTKNNSTYAALGNVFRNSKWTDLKVQNIKNSFVRQFYLLLLFIFSLILLVTTDAFLAVQDVYSFVLDLLFNLLDLVSLLYVLIIYLVFPFLYQPETLITLKGTAYDNKNSTLSIGDGLPTKDYNTVFNLYKTSSSIGNVDLQLRYKYSTELHKTNTINFNTSLTYTPEIDEALGLPSNKNFNISLSNWNKLLSNKYFILNSSNFSKDLNLMKTDRWLLKNSFVSEDIIRNTNSYTNSKKLIGLNLTSSQLSNRNVWASTNLNKLNQSNNQAVTNMFNLNNTDLTKISSKHLNSSNLLNFNFFDESRLFLVNKYLHSSKLRYNILTYSHLVDSSRGDKSVVNSSNFDLNLKLFNTSLNFNTQPFIVSTIPEFSKNPKTPNYSKDLQYFLLNENSTLLTSNNLNSILNLTTKQDSFTWNNYFN